MNLTVTLRKQNNLDLFVLFGDKPVFVNRVWQSTSRCHQQRPFEMLPHPEVASGGKGLCHL